MASKACCSVPPILAVKDYKTKGDYTTTDGKKTCEFLPTLLLIEIWLC